MLHEKGHGELATLLEDFDQEYELTPRVVDPQQLVV
jgi:hypothetical protein